ncbi:helix-turn-helix domain-containing protein [Streptomyces sp. NPDC088762]|uniref:helix-turn-helix domain-containing protein n=1 Tax=Streptomyces sp. NPDC088762 TaxID=3365891 RepID=UPI003809CDED
MTKRELNPERAQRLRAAREAAGLTRAEVCETTGIPAGTLRAAENGVRLPTATSKLVDLYGIADDEPVTDFASDYFARQEQQRQQYEREAAYLSDLEQDPERAEREEKQKPKEAPIGYIRADPPPPPPPQEPRGLLYQRLMIPR